MRKLTLLFIPLFFLVSCIEDYDINFDNNEPRLVVEGLVTNQPGPYYIRLTESKTGGYTNPDYSNIENAVPIMNAFITIKDDLGLIDTLSPIDVKLDEYECNPYLGCFKLLYNDTGVIVDTLFLKDPPEYTNDRGFYKTSKLKGMPGHSYDLQIIVKEKVYNAFAYMPPVPMIDSLGYAKKVLEKDGQEYYIPLLYFKEPQNTTDFYLIQLTKDEASRSTNANSLWQFSILSDAFLEPYVNGLNLDLGISPDGTEYSFLFERDSIYVALSSLTEGAYNFYKALLDQFKNDGGVFKQTPSSPPTNISNGGLGLFRASAVIEKRTIIK